MKINLPLQNFAFFKTISGFIFLVGMLIFPVATFVSLAVLVMGKAHSLGAWLAMWRANKLNWKFLSYILLVIFFVPLVSFKYLTFDLLVFLASLLFLFHFLFDEFDFQRERRNLLTVFFSLNPAVIIGFFLISDFLNIVVPFSFFLVIFLTLSAVELILLKEINWFFINTKVISLFALFSIFIGKSVVFIFSILLIFHYLYWFIYPVYTLHKYKRSERDGLIMILLLVVASSVFIYSTKIWGEPSELNEMVFRGFYIASIVHIFTTAPFAYYFGFPRPKKYDLE